MAKIRLRSARPKGGVRFQPATTRGMRSVAVRARSYDPTSRKFEFVLASETPCRTYRLDRNWNIVEVDEILPMAALRGLEDFRGCPLLDTHSSWSVRDVLGRITALRTEGTQLIGNAFLSDRDDVAGIARDIETGILAEFSVGFDIEDEGTIEEREGDIPLVRVGAWRVREGSLVPLPADSTAVMRGAGSARTISRLRASTSRAGARNTATRHGARAMTPEELEALLDSTFRSATTAIVAALTDATADDGDDTGADDLEAEAEAAAEAARAAILAKGRSKPGKAAPKAPAAPARTSTPAQEAAQKLHARNIAKRNGKAQDFDDLDKAGGTIEELRDLAKRSVSTTPGEIGNAPAPAGKRGLIRLEDSAAGKRKGAAK